MKLDNLQKLLIHELKDLYSAESQLLEALPKMVSAASNEHLKEAFKTHLAQTKGHKKRLEKLFDGLDSNPGGHKCKAMEGLIKEASDILQEEAPEECLDAAMIAAAQRIEHYEIAGYGTARSYAEKLGMFDMADELQVTLDEEAATDRKLSRIAERRVNFEALTVE